MNADWLKLQLQIHPKKTKVALADFLNIAPTAISKILNNQRQIKAQEYILMREFFDMPRDGARALKRTQNSAYTISPLRPETNTLKDGTQNALSETDWVIPAGILTSKTQAPPEQIKIFQITETVMEPDFKQGEHVLVDLSDQTPSPPGVFIISDGFGYMIRQCELKSRIKPPIINISTLKNPDKYKPLPAETAGLIGRVIARIQMI